MKQRLGVLEQLHVVCRWPGGGGAASGAGIEESGPMSSMSSWPRSLSGTANTSYYNYVLLSVIKCD